MAQEAAAPAAQGTAEQIDQFEFPVDAASNPQYAEPEPQAPPPPPPPPPAAKPAHPGYLIRAAKQVGMDEYEIESMDTAELKEAVSLLRDSRPTEQPTAKSQVAEQAPTQDEFELLGIDTRGWHDDDKALLGSVAKPIANKIAALEKHIAELTGRERKRESDAAHDRLDQMFGGDEALFGKGSRFRLAPGSPEMIRRQAVHATMKSIVASNPRLSLEDVFDRAVSALYGQSKPADDVKASLTLRPADRAARPQPKGRDAAVRAVAAALKDAKFEQASDEIDDLPP
jgi:hypothetical protein